ncbi:DUF1405 domain-containing protein [Candidatus Micrarchaeota archaeon]|nr:DUF1405 domain-containing protein [Candidatus Micrarchaeota archaeon]
MSALGKTIFFGLSAIGIIVGYAFYHDQLAVSNPFLWLFIPDCPLYVLLALLVVMFKIKSSWFRLIVSAGLIKYGLWTELVFLIYHDYYFAPFIIESTILLGIGHVVMILESLLFLPEHLKPVNLAVSLSWFLANDFSDYVLGTVPRIPTDHICLVGVLTVLLTFVSVGSVYFATRYNMSKNSVVARLRDFFIG